MIHDSNTTTHDNTTTPHAWDARVDLMMQALHFRVDRATRGPGRRFVLSERNLAAFVLAIADVCNGSEVWPEDHSPVIETVRDNLARLAIQTPADTLAVDR